MSVWMFFNRHYTIIHKIYFKFKKNTVNKYKPLKRKNQKLKKTK